MKKPTLCIQIQSHASQWRDRRLGPDATSLIDAHLRGCAPCRREMAFQDRIGGALRAAPAEQSTRRLSARMKHTLVERAIARSNRPAWRRRLESIRRSPAWPRVGAVAAMLLVVFGAYGLGLRQGQGKASTATPDPAARSSDPAKEPGPLPAIDFDHSASRLLEGLGLSRAVQDAWDRRFDDAFEDSVSPSPRSRFQLSADPQALRLVRAGREIPWRELDESLLQSLAESDDCQIVFEESQGSSEYSFRIEVRRFGGGKAEVSISRTSQQSRSLTPNR